MHRPFLLQNSTLDVLRRVRTRVLLHHVRVLDRHGQFPGIHRKHSPGLPLRSPGHDLHHVSVADAECCRLFLYFSHGYHTSGASEMILVNFLSRNSRATGPKTRVPIGSFASLINTAALSSKRMYVPSLRRCSLRVRTITHFTTVPFFTWLSGCASFTAAVTTSPNPPVNPASPPNGRMQVSCRARELPATVSHVRICPMILPPVYLPPHFSPAATAGAFPHSHQLPVF